MRLIQFSGSSLRISRWVAPVLVSLLAISHGAAATFDFDKLLDSDEPAQSSEAGPHLSSPIDPGLVVFLETARQNFLAGNFESAGRNAKVVTDRAPEMAEGWHLSGMIFANQGAFDDAIAALGKAGTLYAKNAEPYVTQGEILLSLSRTSQAKAAFEKAAEKDPTNWRSLEMLAKLAEQAGQLDAAETHLLAALPLVPGDRLATRINLARVYFNAGRPQDGIPMLREFVAQNPDNLRGLAALGRIELAAGNALQAIKAFETASRLLPTEADLRVLVAVAQTAAGRLDAAAETLQTARTEFPLAPNVYIELGKLQGAQRAYDAAAATYDAGLEIEPTNPKLLKGASLVAFRRNAMDQAVGFAQTLAERPNAPASDILWLATMNERAGDTAGAIASYEAVLKLTPDSWLAMNNLAALITEAQPDRAVTLAAKAAELQPETSAIRDTLGWAHFHAGNAAEAGEIFKELLLAKPNDAALTYKLGETLIADGQKDAGRAMIEDALRLDPSFRLADRARATLAKLP